MVAVFFIVLVLLELVRFFFSFQYLFLCAVYVLMKYTLYSDFFDCDEAKLCQVNKILYIISHEITCGIVCVNNKLQRL